MRVLKPGGALILRRQFLNYFTTLSFSPPSGYQLLATAGPALILPPGRAKLSNVNK